MNSIITIAENELKQQLKRKALYIFFIIITLISAQDVCPLMYSSDNPILTTADFTVYQRLTFRIADGIGLYYFAFIVILVSSRILSDKKTQCLDIIMALPITRKQYILGKIIGNFILFSVLSFCTMIISLSANALFSSLAIEPVYIAFYYIVYVELTILFSIIISSAVSIIADNYKVSIFISLAYFAFSVIGTALIKSSAYFTLFGGKYFGLLRNLGQNNESALRAGLINLSFIAAAIILFLIILLSQAGKGGERRI